jgi:hypothetical protein
VLFLKLRNLLYRTCYGCFGKQDAEIPRIHRVEGASLSAISSRLWWHPVSIRRGKKG